MDRDNPLNKPFHVHTTDGVFHSGHDTADEASARCDMANADAVKLGIQARYSVIAR